MSDNTKAMRLNYKADEINTAINRTAEESLNAPEGTIWFKLQEWSE